MSNATEIYNKAFKRGVYLECKCSDISKLKWDQLMNKATRADKKIINYLVRKAGYCDGWLTKGYNPYNYYKTKTHLILVHSSIEYFFKIL
jgi:hypothetical protein